MTSSGDSPQKEAFVEKALEVAARIEELRAQPDPGMAEAGGVAGAKSTPMSSSDLRRAEIDLQNMYRLGRGEQFPAFPSDHKRLFETCIRYGVAPLR